MSAAINYSDYFTEKHSDISSLESEVNKHPSSSFARFLLLLHYQKNKDPRFQQLSRQTALNFSNPYWLQFQLNQHLVSKAGSEVLPELSSEEITIPENLTENSEVEPAEPEPTLLADQPEIDESKETKQEISENEQEKKVLISEVQESETKAEIDTDTEIAKPEIASSATIIIEEEPQIPTLLNKEKLEENTEETLSFEPLHTIDYFASQGIKINKELLMNDKLGKQMRSFSEWMKSMKQLHPGKMPVQNDVIEKIIQTSAEQSNESSEVLTEAMAEVLMKQNKREKAIEMYEKLSLMNPAKSIYFAAKIESIKTH